MKRKDPGERVADLIDESALMSNFTDVARVDDDIDELSTLLVPKLKKRKLPDDEVPDLILRGTRAASFLMGMKFAGANREQIVAVARTYLRFSNV